MKQTYTFSNNAASRKFYRHAVCVGYRADGRGVWAWKDGLWIMVEHTGATTWYVAHRVSTSDIAESEDTWQSREALASVIRYQVGA